MFRFCSLARAVRAGGGWKEAGAFAAAPQAAEIAKRSRHERTKNTPTAHTPAGREQNPVAGRSPVG
ncbi:hypothetical protein GCM10022402_40440 [Salinactinospora qingdaonensis]|uniref:Uncharacterized protein n=1 Tax=Salinactinospora qingdaonensis TaxID=702744 RepID=A0ABP7G9V5_9ACTN